MSHCSCRPISRPRAHLIRAAAAGWLKGRGYAWPARFGADPTIEVPEASAAAPQGLGAPAEAVRGREPPLGPALRHPLPLIMRPARNVGGSTGSPSRRRASCGRCTSECSLSATSNGPREKGDLQALSWLQSAPSAAPLGVAPLGSWIRPPVSWIARAQANVNSVPSRSIACVMIARRRAKATLALRIVDRLPIAKAQADARRIVDCSHKSERGQPEYVYLFGAICSSAGRRSGRPLWEFDVAWRQIRKSSCRRRTAPCCSGARRSDLRTLP